MKPEAQRIAIAEACGWKRACISIDDDFYAWTWVSPLGSAIGSKWMTEEQCRTHNNRYLPEYIADLNAMHEAEKVLDTDSMSPRGEIAYFNQLESVCGCMAIAIRSTAAQRAEAFLRTIGKWEDGE